MIRKVYSSKFEAVFTIVAIIGFAIGEIVSLATSIEGLIKNEDVIIDLVMTIGFALYLPILIFLGNRSAYTITYNHKEKMLYRKGLFFGYKYQLKVEDIKDVVIATSWREGTYYILLDPYNNRYDACHKKSFIRLQVNDQNRDFIELFWHRPITKELPQSTLIGNK